MSSDSSMERHVHNVLLRGDRGGFATELAKAWCAADSSNRARLEASFPRVFNPVIDLVGTYRIEMCVPQGHKAFVTGAGGVFGLVSRCLHGLESDYGIIVSIVKLS